MTTNTNVDVGSNSLIRGNNVTLWAYAPNVVGDGSATLTAVGVIASAKAHGNVSLNPTAAVLVESGATIDSANDLNLLAQQPNIKMDAYSNATIAGAGGYATGDTYGNSNNINNVTVDGGATLYGQTIEIDATSLDSITRQPNATSYTLEQALESIPLIGWLVKLILGPSSTTQVSGSITDVSLVTVNGNIHIVSRSTYDLTTQPGDKFSLTTSLPNPAPQPSFTGTQVDVPVIPNGAVGSLTIQSSNSNGLGQFSGSGQIYKDQYFQATIINTDPKDLHIAGTGANANPVNPTITYNVDSGTPLTANTGTNVSTVVIDNQPATATDLYLDGDILAYPGSVSVENTGGNIYQTAGTIASTEITVAADLGNIGTSSNAIHEEVGSGLIDEYGTDSVVGGLVEAHAGNNMDLSIDREPDTQFATDSNGNVYLPDNATLDSITAGGSIDITLSGGLAGESPGEANYVLNSISAGGDATIANTDGTLLINHVSSTDATVWLTASGALIDNLGTSLDNVVAQSALLQAGTGIGTSFDAIGTTLGTLSATTNAGDIYDDNAGALTVGTVDSVDGLNSAGKIVVTNTDGPIVVQSDVHAGSNISLLEPDTGKTGEDITVESSATIQTTGSTSSIYLIVGDNITIQAGSTLISPGNVVLMGDEKSTSVGVGDSILISGVINAGPYGYELIYTGPDDDVVSLTNVAAATTAMILTGSGINTINVGSLAPFNDGKVDPIQGLLRVLGNGTDTLNVDDTGSTASKNGYLTPTSITGLNMGPRDSLLRAGGSGYQAGLGWKRLPNQRHYPRHADLRGRRSFSQRSYHDPLLEEFRWLARPDGV